MQVFFYNNNTVEKYSPTFPVTERLTLDESLDTASLAIENITRKEPFAPLTFCEFDGTMWVVASDDVVWAPTLNRWTHNVSLVEPTKWLERFMVGTKTVTQPITKDYDTVSSPYSKPQISGPEVAFSNEKEVVKEIVASNSPFYIPSVDDIVIIPHQVDDNLPLETRYASVNIEEWRVTLVSGGVKIWETAGKFDKVSFRLTYTDSDGKTVTSPSFMTNEEYQTALSVSKTISDPVPNFMELKCEIKIRGYLKLASVSYYFSVVDTTQADPITLLDVAEDLLTIVEPLRAGEKPRFSLSDSAKDKLRGITSPEFTFTNNTLREALDEIGKVIGCITRLHIKKDGDAFVYEIDYDPFCTFEQADTSKLGMVNAIQRSQSVEQYCTTLDSTVDNLMEYNGAGTVMDPGPLAFRTVRTEDTSYQITEAGAVIFTQYPIEVLEKLEIGLKAGDTATGVTIKDATKYCFESAEYATLSSYSPAFPYSKAYALRYAFGQRNITSLAFEMESSVSQIFKQPSLVNVINEIFGTSYNDFGLGGNHLDYNKVLFRVTYRPSVSARVITRKSLSDIPSALAFNQGAAKLDSTAFGRNAYGNVLRMGNAGETRKYTIRNDITSSDLPGCGQIMNDMVVSEVQRTSYASGFDEVVISLTKNFNRLSQYVGIDHSKRIYEISEKLGVDRYVNLEDVCLVGLEDGKTFSSGGVFASAGMTSTILASLLLPEYDAINGADLGRAILRNCFVLSQGEDASGNKLSAALLPVASYGMGTALVFSWRYTDNYSAGTFVNEYDVDSVTSYAQSDARYTDLFGRIDKLGFKLLTNIGDVSSTFAPSYDDRLAEGRLFPLVNDLQEQTDSSKLITVADCTDAPVVIKKDNRETLNVTYQVSFVGRDGVYVMPNLAEAMNAAEPKTAKLYVLDHRVTPLTTNVDVGENSGNSLDFDFDNGKAYASSIAPTSGESVVIATEDGQVYVAANKDVEAGDYVQFNFDFVKPK